MALATVAAQVAYPLVPNRWSDGWTVAIVLLFAAASVTHAWTGQGPVIALAFLLSTAGLGFAVEVLGVHTGFPFGRYAYGDGLGPKVADVPVLIALAWTTFTWPAAIVARTLVRRFWPRVAVTSWSLAAWDLYLDPQLVRHGGWRWSRPEPHLPGVPTVPLTNLLGWLAVGVLISLVVQGILATVGDTNELWPQVLFVWTWLSSALALAAFWDLAAAAGWGFAALGIVAVPLLRGVSAPSPSGSPPRPAEPATG